MTSKEAEHFLIEHDFTYEKDGNYWFHKSNRPQISDEVVQQDPSYAVKYIADELGLTR